MKKLIVWLLTLSLSMLIAIPDSFARGGGGGRGGSHSSGKSSGSGSHSKSYSGTSSYGKSSSTHVKGYYRKDGTYVQPHHRTTPDGTKNNNWSTKGNVNPYTGEPGTKDPDK